ncbi:MAG: hypothetical protein IT447_00160 [Phycisphaerales bacterium]|nr:hypothetical protein [Phycisphaerales bacterium]
MLLVSMSASAQAQPATQPGDSPRQAYERLVVAMREGDGATIRQSIVAQGDDQQRLVDALVNYAQSLSTMRQAAVQTYGAAQSRILTGDPADHEKRLEAIRQAIEQIDGDKATLKVDSANTPLIHMRKMDGHWRVPLGEMLTDLEPGQIAQQIEEMALQVRVFDETTADILAGKFHTADEAAQVMRGRLIRPASEPTTATTKPG